MYKPVDIEISALYGPALCPRLCVVVICIRLQRDEGYSSPFFLCACFCFVFESYWWIEGGDSTLLRHLSAPTSISLLCNIEKSSQI